MKTLTRNETADFLLNNDNYAILTHRRPDGDTIGSSAALCRILRKMGKAAHIIRNGEVTDRFAWLHEGLTKDEACENDTIVTVDVASPGMLPKDFEQYLGRISLRIDHHASATSFTVRLGATAVSWGETPMYCLACSRALVMLYPPTRASPEVGWVSPVRSLIVVVFPAPLTPSRA